MRMSALFSSGMVSSKSSEKIKDASSEGPFPYDLVVAGTL